VSVPCQHVHGPDAPGRGKHVRGNLIAALLMAVALLTAACGSAGPAAAPARSHTAAASSRPVVQASSQPHATAPGPKVLVSHYRAADGSVVTLAEFRGPVSYRLHGGSVDPGRAVLGAVQAGPRVRARERHRLLAAFNGGFLLSAGVGGYEQEGHVIRPLRKGLASLVIDRSGAAAIGVWGAGLPRPGESVFSVRQNLRALVKRGHPSAAAANWRSWGSTLGGGESVARSALGANAAGQLIYAGSMSATPADLAAALVHAGARIAMELDINPEWVQLDVARTPGGSLRAAVPAQVRPADQYLVGWRRDFLTVLGPGPGFPRG
jgi:hypothetical protein